MDEQQIGHPEFLGVTIEQDVALLYRYVNPLVYIFCMDNKYGISSLMTMHAT